MAYQHDGPFDFQSEGYDGCTHIWSGNWNKRFVHMYIWRKVDPHEGGVWKYAIDVRNRYNNTLSLTPAELNHLMAEVIYMVISGERIEEEKPQPIDRLALLFGENS